MKITVIGSGYVGLVTGVCLAELGNDVICLDVDEVKIKLLTEGKVPIYEPGLEEMLLRNQTAGRIRFSSNIQAAVLHGDIQYIAVGTPPEEDGSADLQYVLAAAKNIGRYMNSSKIIVNKSTVPIGTADKVKNVIAEELKISSKSFDYTVVSNPEFLKEGAAIEDFMRPDRIIVGTYDENFGIYAKEVMKKLYAPFNHHHERTYFMDVRSAELTKYAANAMLATRISFMNEIANLADKIGADIEFVRRGIGSDSRIGHSFLYPGIGYGGSCFPKDIKALIKISQENDHPSTILKAVDDVNNYQKSILTKKIKEYFKNNLNGKRISVWGLSFKPNTNDMREAPSRVIIKALVECGAQIYAYDPVAIDEARDCFSMDLKHDSEKLSQINFCNDMYAGLKDSDALIIMTEWKVFRTPDFEILKNYLKSPIIFDGRNIYDPMDMKMMGFNYYGIGR